MHSKKSWHHSSSNYRNSEFWWMKDLAQLMAALNLRRHIIKHLLLAILLKPYLQPVVALRPPCDRSQG